MTPFSLGAVAARRARTLASAAVALGLFTLVPALAQEAAHEEPAEHEEGGVPHYPLERPERIEWTFAGPFGIYDAEQLQRGLKVYRDVCGACHGLTLVAFRTLAAETGPFLSDEAMRAVAAAYRLRDADTGAARPGRPADHFPASNNPLAPDLSLMAKARGVSDGFPAWLTDGLIQYQEGGVNYIHSLLTGYRPAPAGVTVSPGTFYNPFFVSGAAIGMPPPLFDGMVDYADGTPETVDQYARDVSAFLMWAAEPHLIDRKRIGFQAILFLIAFTTLVYFAKRRVWSGVAH